MRGLLSEFDIPDVLAPFGVKLEMNQTHLEFSVPTLGGVSVVFGVSEQAALSGSLYKCLWISRCSLCCAKSLRKFGILIQPWTCSFSTAHPNHAALPQCPEPLAETRPGGNAIRQFCLVWAGMRVGVHQAATTKILGESSAWNCPLALLRKAEHREGQILLKATFYRILLWEFSTFTVL